MSKLRSISNHIFIDQSIDKKYRWNPDITTIEKIIKRDAGSFVAFRKSSTSYGNRVYVRKYIFDKFLNMCNQCWSTKCLEIDHIKSVKACYIDFEYSYCNSLENLQALCQSCNLKKGRK